MQIYPKYWSFLQKKCKGCDKIDNKISKKELLSNLNELKKILSEFDYSSLYNVIFFNLDCYYSFLNNMYTKDKKQKYTLEELLNNLEPYIPFEFDEKTISYLITSQIDDFDSISLQKIFVKRAKVDFINSIKNATTIQKWDKIISTCKSIYEYKEKNPLLFDVYS